MQLAPSSEWLLQLAKYECFKHLSILLYLYILKWNN